MDNLYLFFVVCYNQDAWVNLVKALMLDVKEFLVQYADDIFDVVVKLACLSEVRIIFISPFWMISR